jgi:hypothetical protein
LYIQYNILENHPRNTADKASFLLYGLLVSEQRIDFNNYISEEKKKKKKKGGGQQTPPNA